MTFKQLQVTIHNTDTTPPIFNLGNHKKIKVKFKRLYKLVNLNRYIMIKGSLNIGLYVSYYVNTLFTPTAKTNFKCIQNHWLLCRKISNIF